MASAEVTPAKMASAKATNMASAEVAPTSAKAADMASAEVAPTSAKATDMASPHATTSKVASTTSEVAAPTSSSTMLAKRHRATRHRESTDGDARRQRDDGAA